MELKDKPGRTEQAWEPWSHTPLPVWLLIYSDFEQAAQYLCLDVLSTLDKKIKIKNTSYTQILYSCIYFLSKA